MIKYFQCFFPKWRFFDHIGPFPIHLISTNFETEWHPIHQPIKFTFLNLLWNPHNNLLHFINNLMTKLILESNNPTNSNIQSLAEFTMLKKYCENEIAKSSQLPNWYRFKIVIQTDGKFEDLIISPQYEIKS